MRQREHSRRARGEVKLKKKGIKPSFAHENDFQSAASAPSHSSAEGIVDVSLGKMHTQFGRDLSGFWGKFQLAMPLL